MNIQTETQISASERRIVVLIHSAIAGASLAASLELAGRETLSPLLLIALGCFAVAVPAAIALLVLLQVIYELVKTTNPGDGLEKQNWPMFSSILAVADQIACYLGFLAIFWHFHWIIGMIFLNATLLAFLTVWTAERNIRRRKNETLSPPVSAGRG